VLLGKRPTTGPIGSDEGIEMQIGSSAATRAALVVALLVLAAGPSRAADFTLEVLQGGVSIGLFDETSAEFSCSPFGSGDSCTASGVTLGDLELIGITLDMNPDPFAGGDFTISNNSASTQHFTFIFTVPVTPIGTTTLTSGSVDGGVTEGTDPNDGADIRTVNSGNAAFYSALIDNVLYDTLLPHLNFATAAPGGSASLPHDEFGNPSGPPSQAGPTVASSIGIIWDFDLSGLGDDASLTGTFKVKPIPEPSTALLVGLGLLILARAGRRR
jgi:PEP-CTERM motif